MSGTSTIELQKLVQLQQCFVAANIDPVYDQAKIICNNVIENHEMLRAITRDLHDAITGKPIRSGVTVQQLVQVAGPTIKCFGASIAEYAELWKICMSKYRSLLSGVENFSEWVLGGEPKAKLLLLLHNRRPLYETIDRIRHMNMSMHALGGDISKLLVVGTILLKDLKQKLLRGTCPRLAVGPPPTHPKPRNLTDKKVTNIVTTTLDPGEPTRNPAISNGKKPANSAKGTAKKKDAVSSPRNRGDFQQERLHNALPNALPPL
ncbi:hypothetical protein DRE_06454 [Drechslerella stenobrocha 248]|uniref:Uncharacterized protein n=1 Tax=Drechslerella stenobrocha 248 TaxID=1043628 RepID=W7HLD2_9PEZI|nr:hypothetical protein DRE_06454 [Drechslerella stenobrocha 248]